MTFALKVTAKRQAHQEAAEAKQRVAEHAEAAAAAAEAAAAEARDGCAPSCHWVVMEAQAV